MKLLTVIGIDPSLTATGYAHTDGSLNTVPLDGALLDERLYHLYEWLTSVIKIESPSNAFIEDLPPPTRGHGANYSGMAQGVTRLALMQNGITYTAVSPATLKKFATSRGNATKDDMRMEWYKRTGQDVRDNNQVDAAWLRELGLHLLGVPTFGLPVSHRVALEKVKHDVA